jgi:ATP-dependent helicase/nuclease subunit B
MSAIAKIDSPAFGKWPHERDHPYMALWRDGAHGLFARVRRSMAQRAAHPARTVVLLPYAHLLPLATRLWVQDGVSGFAPRFETTQNWVTALGGFSPAPTDIAFDMALDTLTAQALLRAAGWGAQSDALTPLLVQAAHQLGPLAAGCLPTARAAWAQGARRAATLGMEGPSLALEAAVARVAVEWVAQSAYASDVLLTPEVSDGVDCLLVVQGFATDPLLAALQIHWGDKLELLPLLPPDTALAAATPSGTWAWHACHDAEDEAQRTAACALAHVAAGRYPLALVSTDRALTRRVRSLLEGEGVQIRDETGWKLSTSHAAAQVMALLKAAAWNASSDAVLAWLKQAPAFANKVDALEAALRKQQIATWRQAETASPHYAEVAAVLKPLQGSRTLAEWLAALRTALQTSGMWDALQTDAAGSALVAVLRLVPHSPPQWAALLEQALWATRRMDLVAFTHWVNQALEGASFSPPYPMHEQVVIVPLNQTLARPFAATVLAGCDEVRLNPSPEPPGNWTPAQRLALGLPVRETLQATLQAAWQHVLHSPVGDVLWRVSDDSGEMLSPSPLVQLARLAEGNTPLAADPRVGRSITPVPVRAPQPTGENVLPAHLSASAYEDLRNCPYRFFALRQLGLQAADELDDAVGKRDFGLWLHDVLKRFHETLALQSEPALPVRRTLLQAAADATTQAMQLGEGAFLPFAAAWPAVRERYLLWLQEHEATGAVFANAETEHNQRLGPVRLIGRIDRTDQLPDGTVQVLDYKTESEAATKERVKNQLEDTQMAFYAALLPHDTVQAAYVHVSERMVATMASPTSWPHAMRWCRAFWRTCNTLLMVRPCPPWAKAAPATTAKPVACAAKIFGRQHERPRVRAQRHARRAQPFLCAGV